MQLHRQALYGPPSHCSSYRNLASRAIRPIDLADLSVGLTAMVWSAAAHRHICHRLPTRLRWLPLPAPGNTPCPSRCVRSPDHRVLRRWVPEMLRSPMTCRFGPGGAPVGFQNVACR